MLALNHGTVLLPIDMQQAFDLPDAPRRGNPHCDTNGLALLTAWRSRGWPIIHVRHDSVESTSMLRPGHSGHDFRVGFNPLPGEPLVGKSVTTTFLGTDLDLRLRRMKAISLMVFGIATDMSVSSTVRFGHELGWRMTVASDACDCFDREDQNGEIIPAEMIHRAHLATLSAEFAAVVTTAEVLRAVGEASLLA